MGEVRAAKVSREAEADVNLARGAVVCGEVLDGR